MVKDDATDIWLPRSPTLNVIFLHLHRVLPVADALQLRIFVYRYMITTLSAICRRLLSLFVSSPPFFFFPQMISNFQRSTFVRLLFRSSCGDPTPFDEIQADTII